MNNNKNIEVNNTNIYDVTQRSFLLNEMRNIQQTYGNMGMYCYEIYTLMCGISMKNNISYNMDIHSELMNMNNT